MKKYRYSFPKSAFFIYVLIVLAAVTAIVFAALRLAGVGSFVTAFPALDVASIVVFVIFIALIGWNLFGAYYAFSEDSFIVVQLFSKKTVERDAIRKMVVDEESGVAALYFVVADAPDALCFVTINLKSKDLIRFTEDLRAFKSDVVIETNPMKKDGE